MIKSHQNSFNRMFMFIDLLLVAGAFVVSYYLRFEWLTGLPFFNEERHLPLSGYAAYLPYILIGYLVIFNVGGLYKSYHHHVKLKTFFAVIKVNIYGFVYTMSLLYLLREINLSRKFLGIFAIVDIALQLGVRLIVYLIRKLVRAKGYGIKHVLIVGYSRTAESYIDRIKYNREWGYKVDAIIDDSMAVGTRYKGIKVIGGFSKLNELLATNQYDEVVICLKVSDYEMLSKIVESTEKAGVHTRFAPDFQNVIPTSPEMEDMDGVPVINIRRVPLSTIGNKVLKRTEDLIIGTLALIIAAIPMLIVAIIVKVTSPGPIIYKQVRVGRHNKEFQMYKFRSMRVQDEEEEKSKWTTYGDDRITPFGQFIRKTSIDELPQLFNVLKGEMSLVGPRPERPQFVEQFKEDVPRYMVKHQVRPGMTGWAQIKGYRGDTSIRRRIDFDIYYIENWSVGLDFLIMFRTVFKVLGKDAY